MSATTPYGADDLLTHPEDDESPATDDGEERSYLCRACGNEVTTRSRRTVRNASHTHRFVNPAGFMYKIACFSTAPGAQPIGEYTIEFSWFDDYAWCFVVCAGCTNHLGWHFSGKDVVDFYGLRVDQLEESI